MTFFQRFYACLFSGFLAPASPVAAQDSLRTTCVFPIEKSPELPTGGGWAAIVKDIQQQINYSPSMLRKPVKGRVFVSFIITATGTVNEVKIVKGLRPDYDAAAIKAVEDLPSLIPGEQNGKRYAQGFTVPVTFVTMPWKRQ